LDLSPSRSPAVAVCVKANETEAAVSKIALVDGNI